MKHWKCPKCARLHETEDNIIIVMCDSCQFPMIIFPYKFVKEKEVKNEDRK